MKTLIRLLPEEQSDLGLHCLPKGICSLRYFFKVHSLNSSIACTCILHIKSNGYNLGWFSGHFLKIFQTITVCFVVAMCDLVTVSIAEAIFHLPLLLTASGNLF